MERDGQEQVTGFAGHPGKFEQTGLFEGGELFIGGQARGWIGLRKVGWKLDVGESGFYRTNCVFRGMPRVLTCAAFEAVKQRIECDNHIR